MDLHVHTPASGDVRDEIYGASEPKQLVEAAINAGLDAIAITDHNTADWCALVGEAAIGTPLVVLPGMEISTAEGHLLAIWEEGTPPAEIEDVLVVLGVRRSDHGKLEIATEHGLVAVAREVVRRGGIAIPAHVDRTKGLYDLKVAAHRDKTLLEPSIAAVEIAGLSTEKRIKDDVNGRRQLACVRGSDVTLPPKSEHVLSGIGNRRTWIKASRPDLTGIKHALADPDLRVSLKEPEIAAHAYIDSVRVTGGFLGGQEFSLSPDLNCLLGGTGAGKSLLLELIRFALDEQTDGESFPAVRAEVDSRLEYALGENSTVEVVLRAGQYQCVARRTYSKAGASGPEFTGDAEHFLSRAGRMQIRAFSQSEVIEYARRPVARMSLVDSSLDLSDLQSREFEIQQRLLANGNLVSDLKRKVLEARARLKDHRDVAERLKELEGLFDAELVKKQAGWNREKSWFAGLSASVSPQGSESVGPTRKAKPRDPVEENEDLYLRASKAYAKLDAAILAANQQLAAAYSAALVELDEVASEWNVRYADFDTKLTLMVNAVDASSKGLGPLRKRLTELQLQKAALDDLSSSLESDLQPALVQAIKHRKAIIDDLEKIRKERRRRRQARINVLNSKMINVVRIALIADQDDAKYKADLIGLARGSRLRSTFLDALVAGTHPAKLVQAYLDNDPESVSRYSGTELRHVQALFDYVEERGLESDLLAMQGIELSDGLSVDFKKHGQGGYEAIERLAHGQKCTAIIIVALADGTYPLVIDQPEDALHAPWIEEYLVGKLRSLRGSRQYIFATRSPGLVVSADAEMLITLNSDSSRGVVEACGSLERHDLNRLALYHLEGGPLPFGRRASKLSVSMSA